MRRTAVLLVAAAIVVGACGSSTATSTTGGGGGGSEESSAPGGGTNYWSGTGSAQISAGGQTVTVSPGGCYDGGEQGVDFRFGSWETPTGGDWVVGIAHSDGTQPEAISGSVNGNLFVLGDDRAATYANGQGTFSGTDSVGDLGQITGTFTCS
jgi:hypothetical protein